MSVAERLPHDADLALVGGCGCVFYDSIKFALLLIGIIFLVTNNLGGGSQAGRQPP